ncbi:hypothetical protein [Paraburkholderia sacchari]|uniref:hypothetical protein n=1 Tax=Paraburkholderia sacchari TaxID=159450 RepID=UPI00054307D6
MSKKHKIMAVSGSLQRPSRTLPIDVYASESDFDRYEIASEALRPRIALSVERATPQLRARAENVTAALAA